MNDLSEDGDAIMVGVEGGLFLDFKLGDSNFFLTTGPSFANLSHAKRGINHSFGMNTASFTVGILHRDHGSSFSVRGSAIAYEFSHFGDFEVNTDTSTLSFFPRNRHILKITFTSF